MGKLAETRHAPGPTGLEARALIPAPKPTAPYPPYRLTFYFQSPYARKDQDPPLRLTKTQGMRLEIDAKKRLASRIGSRIARARTNAGYTQDDVAERLGIGNEAVSRMERGAAMPSVERLYEFAELYGCRVDELLLDSSSRETDLGAAIAQKISGLPQGDREVLVALIGQLSDHLRGKRKSQR